MSTTGAVRREYLQLGIYPTSGRVSVLDTNEVTTEQQRTCLFLNLLLTSYELSKDVIGIQLNVDADTRIGGYADFDTKSTLMSLQQQPQAITNPRTETDPVTITGRGELMTADRLTTDTLEIRPTHENRTAVPVHLSAVCSQNRTGIEIQFGDTDTEGASITLTPFQSNHFARMLSDVLRGEHTFTTPENTERGVVNPHGTLKTINYDAFSRNELNV